MNLTRRKFLIGAAGLIAAPAIVKYANLMPVRVIEEIYHYDVATLYMKERNWLGWDWIEVRKQLVNDRDRSVNFYLPNSHEDFKMVHHKTGDVLHLIQSSGSTGTAAATGPQISWVPETPPEMGVAGVIPNRWDISSPPVIEGGGPMLVGF